MSDSKSQEMGYGERIGSGGTDAILSSYFRQILLDLHIDANRFQALLDRYIVGSGLASNTAEISTSRSALHRELMSPTMTWKVFIKGLRFLRVEKVEIILTLFRDEDLKTSTHSLSFNVNVEDKDIKDDKLEDDDNKKDIGHLNTLARFFESIRMELDMTKEMFNEYLQYYVVFAKPGSTTEQQYTAKCSLDREVNKNNISWKVFIKSLILLKTYRMKMELLLTHRNTLVTYHEKIVVFK